jgi:hypothetical protein
LRILSRFARLPTRVVVQGSFTLPLAADAKLATIVGKRDAIRTALRFLLGGRYANLREMAKENFETNP